MQLFAEEVTKMGIKKSKEYLLMVWFSKLNFCKVYSSFCKSMVVSQHTHKENTPFKAILGSYI